MKLLAHPRQPMLIVQTASAELCLSFFGLRYVELVLCSVAITLQGFVFASEQGALDAA